jgi:hypothetical protein
MPPAEFRLTARAAYRTQMVRRAVAHLKVGGARRDRTDDLVNAIHALSQLSYGPTFGANTGVSGNPRISLVRLPRQNDQAKHPHYWPDGQNDRKTLRFHPLNLSHHRQ